MRWRQVLVAGLLAAPIGVVVVVAWPAARPGRGPLSDLHAGDSVDGVLGPGGVDAYDLPGAVDGTRIAVRGANGFDTTITVVDPGSGEQLAYNDDTSGLDPEVTLDLPDARDVSVEVRGFSGAAGAYTITVG